jgi:hypothetical protein
MSNVVTISQNVNSVIETIAKKFDLDTAYVMSVYMKYATSGNDEKKALLKTKGDIETDFGNLLSNAPTLYGYVLNDYGPSDILEAMRNKAKRMYDESEESKQKAIDMGMISYDGVPLDYRNFVNFGKPNENKGMPLEGSLWQRSVLAIIATDKNFTSPTMVELTADGDFARDMPIVEAQKFYQFRGNLNPKYPSKVRLSNGTKFVPITAKVSAADVANKLQTVDISDVDTEYAANFAGKKGGNYLAAIRGSVLAMNLNAIGGNRTFVLTDEAMESQIRCKINEKAEIVFQQADEVIIFARLFPGKDGKIGAQVRTYMVVA